MGSVAVTTMSESRRKVVNMRRPASTSMYGRQNRPSNRRSHRLPRLNLRWSLAAFVTLLVCIGWSQLFSIRRIVIKGNKSIETAQLESATRSELQKSLWSGNITTVDTDQLAKQLQEHLLLIKSVEVGRLWPNGLELRVTERIPSLIWKSANKSYQLDIDGTVIAEVAGEGSKLPVVLDGTNLPVKVGERVVGARFVEFCTGLVQAMVGQTGLGITGMRIPDTTTEVYVTTSKGYVVKFDTTRSVQDALASLNRVLAELARLKKPPPSEYIDLRIAGKAYYK